MSDLAAPIFCVMRDEAEAFWCFACLMEKLEVRPAHLSLHTGQLTSSVHSSALASRLDNRCMKHFFSRKFGLHPAPGMGDVVASLRHLIAPQRATVLRVRSERPRPHLFCGRKTASSSECDR